MGESTTQGHSTDVGNYPVYLKATLEQRARGYAAVEMINAGVSGWTSDQLALRAERQLAAYRPDIVVLYAGWNDFQSYDPFGPPPTRSYFEQAFGVVPPGERLGLRSVQLLSAAYTSVSTRVAGKMKSLGAARSGATGQDGRRVPVLPGQSRPDRGGVSAAGSRACGSRSARWWRRWPMAPPEDRSGPLWIKARSLSQTDAAGAVARFNDLIREYARAHDLILIDAAATFASLDRQALMWDFIHMHAEGYELLALVIYDGLVRAGAVAGAPSPRLEALMAKYRLGAAPASS